MSRYIAQEKLLRKKDKDKSYDEPGREKGVIITDDLDGQIECRYQQLFFAIEGFRDYVSQAETQSEHEYAYQNQKYKFCLHECIIPLLRHVEQGKTVTCVSVFHISVF